MDPMGEATGTTAEADLGPVTYNRALTSIVQCGSHLRRAQDELRLAVQILRRLDDPAAPWPRQPGRRAHLLRPLEEFLDGLSGSETQLSEAARATRDDGDPAAGDRLRSA